MFHSFCVPSRFQLETLLLRRVWLKTQVGSFPQNPASPKQPGPKNVSSFDSTRCSNLFTAAVTSSRVSENQITILELSRLKFIHFKLFIKLLMVLLFQKLVWILIDLDLLLRNCRLDFFHRISSGMLSTCVNLIHWRYIEFVFSIWNLTVWKFLKVFRIYELFAISK